jgi:hypothetical protein
MQNHTELSSTSSFHALLVASRRCRVRTVRLHALYRPTTDESLSGVWMMANAMLRRNSIGRASRRLMRRRGNGGGDGDDARRRREFAL